MDAAVTINHGVDLSDPPFESPPEAGTVTMPAETWLMIERQLVKLPYRDVIHIFDALRDGQ